MELDFDQRCLTAQTPGTCEPGPDRLIDDLYRKEITSVRHYVARIVRDRGDGEDIVQNAFVRTWRAICLGSVRSPRAVLYRTARNLALNHLRDGRVRDSDARRAALSDVFDHETPNAEEVHIADEDAVACRRLLDGLPPRCREALILKIVDELSYAEMASRMHLSISTIEKHVSRGKQIFRTQMTAGQFKRDDIAAAVRPAA